MPSVLLPNRVLGLSVRGGGGGFPWANLPGGNALHAWDFLNNTARWNGASVGALSNTPGWSFARASAGYAQTAAGVLTHFASGELRRTDKGVLIEGARTNLCLQSQTFDNASWTTSTGTLTANQAVAPDGTTTADKLVGDAASANGRVVQTFTGTIGATYTLSVYAKTAGGTLARLYFDDSGTNIATVTYDTITGAVSSAAGVSGGNWTSPSSTSTALGNGWWRFSLTFTATTVAPTRVALWHRDTSDGTNGLYLWGAQLEAASFPSSYIPTTTASATRAADVLTVPVSGIDYPLSLYSEWELSSNSTVQSLFAATNAAGDNRHTHYINTTARAITFSGGVNQAQNLGSTPTAGTRYKLASRCSVNSFQLAMGGALATEDTSGSVPTTPTNVVFGTEAVAGSNFAFAYLRRCALWTRALTDSELQTVTT